MAAVVRDAGEGALLVGHSYGGLIAAGAAQRPRRPAAAGPLRAADGRRARSGRADRPLGAADPGGGDRDLMVREFFREVGRLRRGRDRRAGALAGVGAAQRDLPDGAARAACRAGVQARPGSARAARHADAHAARQREPRLGAPLDGRVRRGDPDTPRSASSRGTATAPPPAARSCWRASCATSCASAASARGTCSFWRDDAPGGLDRVEEVRRLAVAQPVVVDVVLAVAV